MAWKRYRLIQDEDVIDEASMQHYERGLGFSIRGQFVSGVVAVSLAVSLITNVIFIILHFRSGPHEVSSTTFASLERDQKIAWDDDSDFASHNRTIWDQAWDSLNPDIGFVAISDDFTKLTGLHESQRWPWDPAKGLYLLQGYHSLHCLTRLRASLTEMHDKKPQTIHFTHINHCLDALRQEIICNADDTPRYSGLDQKRGTGKGQIRMCRDWRKLEEWANGHSACYTSKYGIETIEGGIPLESFKHCPDGSKPWKTISDKN